VKTRLVIFDLDGTLVRLGIDYETVRKELRNALGQAGSASDFRPLLEEIERVARQAAVDNTLGTAQLRQRAFSILDRHEVAAARRCQHFQSASELLHSLRKRRFLLALCTANGRACVDELVDRAGWQNTFEAIVCRDTPVPPKPSPRGIQLIRETVNVSSSSTVMVGDSWRDVAAARRAGVRSVHFCRDGAPDNGADAVISELQDLSQILTREE